MFNFLSVNELRLIGGRKGPISPIKKTPLTLNPIPYPLKYIQMKYNRNNIQEHLCKNKEVYNINGTTVGYILGLVDDINNKKINLTDKPFGSTPVTVQQIFEMHDIEPEPVGAVEVTHIPHQHIIKIFISCDDIIVAVENPLTGDVSGYKTKETTIDHLGIHGIFELIQ